MTTSASSRPGTLAADDVRLGAWRAFIHANALLLRRMDEELQATHGLSLAEYDALVQLVSAPERRLRMSALAERVLLSRSGITRLVDRLEAAGMVARTACVTDARGAEAALTPLGVERLRVASRTHLEGVQRYFLAAMSDDDRGAVERACQGVLDELGREPAGGAACEPSTA
jgi:DNA-binding MarR family transcriptional regulator